MRLDICGFCCVCNYVYSKYDYALFYETIKILWKWPRLCLDDDGLCLRVILCKNFKTFCLIFPPASLNLTTTGGFSITLPNRSFDFNFFQLNVTTVPLAYLQHIENLALSYFPKCQKQLKPIKYST